MMSAVCLQDGERAAGLVRQSDQMRPQGASVHAIQMIAPLARDMILYHADVDLDVSPALVEKHCH